MASWRSWASCRRRCCIELVERRSAAATEDGCSRGCAEDGRGCAEDGRDGCADDGRDDDNDGGRARYIFWMQVHSLCPLGVDVVDNPYIGTSQACLFMAKVLNLDDDHITTITPAPLKQTARGCSVLDGRYDLEEGISQCHDYILETKCLNFWIDMRVCEPEEVHKRYLHWL